MPENVIEQHLPSVAELVSQENTNIVDATVKEIFEMMFGLAISADEACAAPRPAHVLDQRTAIVGFSGTMRGSCQIRIGRAAAESIASAMLGGSPLNGNDESINDAIGELCNMLAGGWKNGIPQLASGCSLSPPTVVVGLDYKIQMSKTSSRFSRTYKFDEHVMDLALFREEPV